MPAARPTAWWSGCNSRAARPAAFPWAAFSLLSGPLCQWADLMLMTDDRTPIRGSARGIGARILETVTTSHARAVGYLVLFSLLCFLPGFFNIPPVDRDEARFAQATKQMIESGEFVDIRFQDEVRYKKPVGIYWLQAAAVRAGAALSVPDATTTIW